MAIGKAGGFHRISFKSNNLEILLLTQVKGRGYYQGAGVLPLDIYADLATTVVHTNNASTLPRINVYAEDGEGFDFLNALLIRHKGKKFIKAMRQITLGCTNYMQLIKKGIPEFSEKSLIALDGDAQEAKKFNSVILLPGTLPPEQLIFEFLYNLKPDDEIWQNGIRFNRPALTNISREISRTLSITQDPINLTDLISAFRTNHGGSNPKAKHPSLREIFKDFYQSPEFQAFLSLKGPKNPWNRWIREHQAATKTFGNSFSQKLVATMIKGYGIEASNIPDITER
ncbi:hypothetical protein [Polynucleobacter sp. AM-25C3]|uniref:hypothetical protein n=1 Tax=Polynucleobacter sp. AM-25C3 TaxID=1855569 RepID=UPI001C0B7C8E|nr:hypothetical protein [Polynucleobacter sp. AM-25C3]MBU3600755.1 hypothetical protein [Polynucleobacter sp. AM-25C3]